MNFQPVTVFLNEQQLLEAIGTSHDVMEIESDDENEMEKKKIPQVKANARTKQPL